MISVTRRNRWPSLGFEDPFEWERDFRREARPCPALNAWLSDEDVVIDVELPGFDPKDVNISVVGDELTLSGKRDGEKPEEGGAYYTREIARGSFSRSLRLPFRVEADKVTANYKNGILRVALPRAEADKAKKIAIAAK